MGSKTAKHKVGKAAAKASARELSEGRWAVISFERCEAKGLSYNEAARKLKELLGNGSVGLCIVTDSVAERISSK